MDSDRSVKRILDSKIYGTRKRGRPRGRWIDEVGDDMRMLRIKS